MIDQFVSFSATFFVYIVNIVAFKEWSDFCRHFRSQAYDILVHLAAFSGWVIHHPVFAPFRLMGCLLSDERAHGQRIGMQTSSVEIRLSGLYALQIYSLVASLTVSPSAYSTGK